MKSSYNYKYEIDTCQISLYRKKVLRKYYYFNVYIF